MKKMTALESRVKVLESNLLDNLRTIDKLNGSIAELSKKLDDSEKRSEKNKDEATAAVRAEIVELDERKNNVVVFGLAESEAADVAAKQAEDNVKVSDLFETIEAQDCKFTVKHRAGKPNADKNKPRPLIVNLESVAKKDVILSKARNLKGKLNYTKVFIAPDWTKRQREDDRLKEDKLKKEAEDKNKERTEDEENEFFWKVVGPKGKRRVAKWWTQPRRQEARTMLVDHLPVVRAAEEA